MLRPRAQCTLQVSALPEVTLRHACLTVAQDRTGLKGGLTPRLAELLAIN